MSKLSFRARALDAARPLPIYRAEALLDLQECVSINRAVPQMPTGMEREEEAEHHLQRAISAHHVYGEKREGIVIPVPKAESNVSYYNELYRGDFTQPKQLIHLQPFSLESDLPEYDMDSEDEAFLQNISQWNTVAPLQFEEMIDRLERGSGQQLVTLHDAKLLLKEEDEVISKVHGYWREKRLRCKVDSLIPTVRQDRREGTATVNPYIAFRRRTEKMQTRKNRKNDEASYEKMLKLRRDLSRAVTILEMVKRRETSKQELLKLTLDIVEKRYQLGDFGGELLAEMAAAHVDNLHHPCGFSSTMANGNQYRHHNYHSFLDCASEVSRPKRKYEKKRQRGISRVGGMVSGAFTEKALNQYDFHSSGDESGTQVPSSEEDVEEEELEQVDTEVSNPDGRFAFRRRHGCLYQAPWPDGIGDWPWEGDGSTCASSRYRFSLTTLAGIPHRVGLIRQRVGRGGRLVLDIAGNQHDRQYQNIHTNFLSVDTFTTQNCHSSAFPPPSDPSASVPSSRPSSSSASLLSELRAGRLRHFTPRGGKTVCHRHNEGHAHWCKRRHHSPLMEGDPLRGDQCAQRGITEQQFFSHRQQLHAMQRDQLAAQYTASTITTEGGRCLDTDSVLFAVSAVVGPGDVGMQVTRGDGISVFSPSPNGLLPIAGAPKPSISPGTLSCFMPTCRSPSPPPTGLITPVTIGPNSALGLTHSLPSPSMTGGPIAGVVTACPFPGGTLAGQPQHPSPAAFPLPGLPPCPVAALPGVMRASLLSTRPMVAARGVSPGVKVGALAPINAGAPPRTPSAPPPSTIKLATAASGLAKVSPVGSVLSNLPRDSRDAERSSLGLAEKAVVMEVT
uniref:enhancer of polycomb homolog 1-like isoform X2 n=1 Tax=Myxine glutinosa TaxID=7769 RepID=UPI00358F5B18